MLMTHHPASFGRHIARMELAAEIPQVVSGVIKIYDFGGSREYFLRPVPDPFRTVSHDHFLLCPVPASLLGLGVQAAGELFGRFDRYRIGGAVFVSHWPAFGIHRGLREDTAELDLPGVRPSVASFALPPLQFFAHHGHAGAIHLHIHHWDRLAHRDAMLSVVRSTALVVTSSQAN